MTKRFFTLFTALVFAVVFGSAAFSADKKPMPKKPTPRGMNMMHGGFGMLNMLEEKLGLSETQVKQIFEINQEYRAKQFELRRSKDKAQREALTKEEQEKIRAVLTDEQKAKLDELKAERKGKHDRKDKDGDKKDRKDGKHKKDWDKGKGGFQDKSPKNKGNK